MGQNTLNTFAENRDAVYDLLKFDELILDFVSSAVRTVADAQAKAKNVPQPWDVRHVLKIVEDVRLNASLRPRYQAMYNQAIVLLVSHFSSAARSLYMELVASAVQDFRMPPGLTNQQITASVWELGLVGGDNIPSILASILGHRKDVSFQDMQSIARTFKTHLAYEPPRDLHTNNIVLAQAARHVIVHNSGRWDDKAEKQVEQAIPRTVKEHVSFGTLIQFQPDEVRTIGDSMSNYLERTRRGVLDALPEHFAF